MCNLYVSLTIEDVNSRTWVLGSVTGGYVEDMGFLSFISQLEFNEKHSQPKVSNDNLPSISPLARGTHN
jgi:hypothetical protein